MSLRKRFFAATYDRQLAKVEAAGLHAQREELLTQARGDVLEVGAGTGVNLGLYDGAVTSLTLTEPEPAMLKRLERNAHAHAPAPTVLRAPAEDLPFEDESFDTVVSTLVLCGVNDQPRAVRELRRVLRDGGTFLFIEHVRADDAKVARLQDRMNWMNRLVVCCDCNRPTLDVVAATGFALEDVEHSELQKVPPFTRPLVIGVATKH